MQDETTFTFELWPGSLDSRRGLDLSTDTMLQIQPLDRVLVWSFFFPAWQRTEHWSNDSDPVESTCLDSARAWLSRIRTWPEFHPPDCIAWTAPFLDLVWWQPDMQAKGLPLRLLYTWLKRDHENPLPRDRRSLKARVGAALGSGMALLVPGGPGIEAWGTARSAAQALARKAALSGVWINRAYYETVYDTLPGRAMPPTRLPGERKAVPIYKMEWGVPGMYLIHPPEM